MKFIYLVLFFVAFATIESFSQTKSDIDKIVSVYDLSKIDDLTSKIDSICTFERKELLKVAEAKKMPLKFIDSLGNVKLLWKLIENKPTYITTFNKEAAISTRTNFLYSGGELNLNIEGQNMSAFIWDINHPEVSHQEFDDNGSSKVTIGDTFSVGGNHATHVLGTMIANGEIIISKGMAPKANSYAFNAINDKSEVLSAVNFGMLLSNHSYGFEIEDLPDWQMGAYINDSALWDEIMYNAPYYLKVNAAGNDGDDNTSNGLPLDGQSSYDKLSYDAVSKNGLAVANANDLIVNSDGEIISGGIINSLSSEGPTDDLRIKPDITGNGTTVFSSITGNTYAEYSGTSMASPNVCGSLLLLQQLYNQENSSFMRAATLKGLALHTADDMGSYGPDARYGWGYLNTKKAAETILDSEAIISELVLNNGNSNSFDVVSTGGGEPLVISISWTDLKGTVNTGIANDPTPVLVNDLDLRVYKDGTEYFPWKLSSVTTNDHGDNIVDPFEKIEIFNPGSSTYSVVISHKGALVNASQNYSLIVSGISSNNLSLEEVDYGRFNVYPNPAEKIINVSFSNELKVSKFVLTDLLGKIVNIKYAEIDTHHHELDYSFVGKGVYFLKIYTNKKKFTRKIVLN